LRQVNFTFSAANTLSWQADANYTLVAMYSSVTAVASLEPGLTFATFSATTSDRVDEFVRPAALTAAIAFRQGLSFDLLKDQKIFVATSAAGIVQLFFELQQLPPIELP
jgi:hypothetical protein